MPDEVIEYAIQWVGPDDVEDTLTVIGTGLFNKDKGFSYLDLCGTLPGKLTGRVVQRTITWSPWEGVQDDGASHLPGPSGFWQVHPGS